MCPPPPHRHAASTTKVRTQNICWYLDATFCYQFFSMNEDGTDVVLVLRLHLSPHPHPTSHTLSTTPKCTARLSLQFGGCRL